MDQKEFIKKYLADATSASVISGILPDIILTQAAHESGWGKYAFGNNFFGIKCGNNWTGDRQLLRTTEYSSSPNETFPVVISKEYVIFNGIPKYKYIVKDYFRKYPSASEGFVDYVTFLKTKKRYAKAFQYTDNPTMFFAEIAKAGYATDPNYKNKLITLHEKIKNTIDECSRENRV